MKAYLSHPVWKLIAIGEVLLSFGMAVHFATSFVDFIGVFCFWVGLFVIIDAIVMHFVKHPAIAVDVTLGEEVSTPFRVAEAQPFPPESTLHVVHPESGKDTAHEGQ